MLPQKRHSLLITQVMCIGSILHTLLPSEVSFKVLFKIDLAAVSLTAESFQITLPGIYLGLFNYTPAMAELNFAKILKCSLPSLITLQIVFPLMSLKSFFIVIQFIQPFLAFNHKLLECITNCCPSTITHYFCKTE